MIWVFPHITKSGGSFWIWNFSNWLLVPRTYNLERIRGSVVPVEDLELQTWKSRSWNWRHSIGIQPTELEQYWSLGSRLGICWQSQWRAGDLDVWQTESEIIGTLVDTVEQCQW